MGVEVGEGSGDGLWGGVLGTEAGCCGDDFVHVGVDVEGGGAGGLGLNKGHVESVVAVGNKDVEVGFLDSGVDFGERLCAMKSDMEVMFFGVFLRAGKVRAVAVHIDMVGDF